MQYRQETSYQFGLKTTSVFFKSVDVESLPLAVHVFYLANVYMNRRFGLEKNMISVNGDDAIGYIKENFPYLLPYLEEDKSSNDHPAD